MSLTTVGLLLLTAAYRAASACLHACRLDPNLRCKPFCNRFAATECACSGADACRLCCQHDASATASPFCPRYMCNDCLSATGLTLGCRGTRWQNLTKVDGSVGFACYASSQVRPIPLLLALLACSLLHLLPATDCQVSHKTTVVTIDGTCSVGCEHRQPKTPLSKPRRLQGNQSMQPPTLLAPLLPTLCPGGTAPSNPLPCWHCPFQPPALLP